MRRFSGQPRANEPLNGEVFDEDGEVVAETTDGDEVLETGPPRRASTTTRIVHVYERKRPEHWLVGLWNSIFCCLPRWTTRFVVASLKLIFVALLFVFILSLLVFVYRNYLRAA